MAKIRIEIDTGDEGESTKVETKRLKRGVWAVTTPVLGIVSSTQFSGTTLAQSFLDGLRASGWEWDPTKPAGSNGRVNLDIRDELGAYGGAHHDLNDAVQDLNGNANVKAIVCVGGLPAAHAAATLSTSKPFLVIIGAMPNFNLNPHGLFRGGINLNTAALNIDRNQYLHNHYGVQQNRVCLIYNSNNDDFSQIELQAWRHNHWPDESGVSGNNNSSHFAQAFANAQQKADAVVISSDPFFSYARDDLVKAANNSGLTVGYPFGVYTTASPQPAPGKSMWYGPDLDAAYTLAGSKTGSVLSDPTTSAGMDTANPAGPVYL